MGGTAPTLEPSHIPLLPHYDCSLLVYDAASALALLERLGAPPRLVRHHELVVEAARELVAGLRPFASSFDATLVLIGAALHDAGKILHPEEVTAPGHHHELAGRELLVEHGLGDLARFCISHARWDDDGLPLEDLLVALADKLWKGKRVPALEQRVVDRLSNPSSSPSWEVFTLADEVFERIAARGDERLARSV